MENEFHFNKEKVFLKLENAYSREMNYKGNNNAYFCEMERVIYIILFDHCAYHAKVIASMIKYYLLVGIRRIYDMLS